MNPQTVYAYLNGERMDDKFFSKLNVVIQIIHVKRQTIQPFFRDFCAKDPYSFLVELKEKCDDEKMFFDYIDKICM